MTLTDQMELPPRVTRTLLDRLERRVAVEAGGRGEIPVFAPFNGTRVGTVPEGQPEDVERAVARSREAQADWQALSVATRSRLLARFHDLLIDRAEEAMDLAQLEAGKARSSAFEEVFDVVATTRYYIKVAPRLLRARRRSVSFPILTSASELRHPHGIVGFITPWNFPFNLGIGDAIPALLAGNGVVIKPDEKTPFTTLYSVDLLAEAGLPEGLVQVVTGEGEVVGTALVDEVDYVMFTGSTAVGRFVAERAGRRLIGASMELGGKNAAIVLRDADLSVAVPGVARSAFANGGQICVGMERIYVEEPLLDAFTRRFVDYVDGLRLSAAYDFTSDLSSMITTGHAEAVHAHVEDAVSKGASILTGGKPRPDIGPAFYEPTVLVGVDESMELCRTETFGPVVSIYGVASADEAVNAANDSEFGLNHSVWTRDASRGRALAARLQAGTVGVNDGYAATWSAYDAPMGGVKGSGLSRRHGTVGLLKYTESQTIATQRLLPAFAPPPGMSFDRYIELVRPLLKLARHLPFYK